MLPSWNRQGRRSPDWRSELAKSALEFEVERCVIGTKLEVYSPSPSTHSKSLRSQPLSHRWTVFGYAVIRFCERERAPDSVLLKDLSTKLQHQSSDTAQDLAEKRKGRVDIRWDRPNSFC
jgi:hypothetical protein